MICITSERKKQKRRRSISLQKEDSLVKKLIKNPALIQFIDEYYQYQYGQSHCWNQDMTPMLRSYPDHDKYIMILERWKLVHMYDVKTRTPNFIRVDIGGRWILDHQLYRAYNKTKLRADSDPDVFIW
jgi:hypothetical protein